MAPAIEIATFQASAALLEDHTLLRPALSTLSRADGFLSAYRGFQVEDETRVFLVIAWENVKARNAFKSTGEYWTVLDQLQPTHVGPVDTLYVEVDGDHALATLAYPVTELVVCKLKDGIDFRPVPVKSTVEAIADALLGSSDEMIHPPSTYVRKVELPMTCCIAVGWDTPQVRQSNFREAPPKAAATRPRYDEIVELTLVHVPFMRFDS